MSTAGITCARTVGQARNLCSTALAVGAFLATTAARFAFSLDGAEGSVMSVASLWTAAVTPVLPLLCAVLAMDSWSEERRTGRLEMLLTLPVRERELVVGKYLGVLCLAFGATVFSLVANLAVLLFIAPSALSGVGILSFLPALFATGLQCALYVSVCCAVSAFLSNAVAAVTLSAALVWALPRGIWLAMVAWSPSGSETLGDFPLDAQALDLAAGLVSIWVPAAYFIFTTAALFVADKALFGRRFQGRKAVAGRLSTGLVMILAVLLAVAMSVLAYRLDSFNFELPLGAAEFRLSERTLGILRESHGDVTATCFLPRADRRFRSVSHLLRALARESPRQGGSRISVRYIDPRWDIGEATSLSRDGVKAPAIVFICRNRRTVVPLAEGWSERTVASALQRLGVHPMYNAVYWTVGHGEASCSEYGPGGMSDIARELSRDGYRSAELELTGDATIPSDCALIAVAGAKHEFSRAETSRIDAFLRQGGRLLLLADGDESALLTTLLPSWGAIVKGTAAKPPRTLSGTDAVLSEFGPHPVSEPLRGSQVVLERPVLFAPSAAAGLTGGAATIDFSTLVAYGDLAAAVMLERGAGAGNDTTIRPTRIAVIGDSGFVANAQLEARANANRDLFLNCVAYLSGSHALTQGDVDGGRFVTGLDRRGRLRLLNVSAIVIPLSVTLIMLLVVWRRRHR